VSSAGAKEEGMKRGIVVFAAIAIVATGAVSVTAAPPVMMHCAGHETADKVEGEGTFVVGDVTITVDGPTVYFTDAVGNPVVVEFCVKAAGSNSGVQTGSSFTVDWVNKGGNTPDISYVVLFGEVDEETPPVEEEPPIVEE
jgi:hypothetical protein